MSNIITESQNRIKVKLIKVLEGFRGKDSKVRWLPNGTDIDTVLEEGEYLIKNVTCSSGFPDIVGKHVGQPGLAGLYAYIKVIKSDFGNSYGSTIPAVRTTQICIFYHQQSGSGSINFDSIFLRLKGNGDGEGAPVYWVNKDMLEEKFIEKTSGAYVADHIYPNTIYFCGNFINPSSYNPGTIHPFTELTLSNLPDSPYPIEIYFKTGNTFSGITASQIKAWIGSTELDVNSGYKITITNLVGKIEKLTMVE